MSNEKTTLVCTRVLFRYSPVDEEMFMFGLQNVPCIESIELIDYDLLLHLSSKEVSLADYMALKSIFKRYKIRKPEQLDTLIVNDEDTGDPDKQ